MNIDNKISDVCVNKTEDSFVQVSLKTDDYYSFKSECSCFSHDLSVQFDKDGGFPSIVFYDKVYINEDLFDDNKSWFTHLIGKIKLAWKCLFDGGFEVEHGFIFKGNKHIKDFMDYMNRGYSIILSKEEKEIKEDNQLDDTKKYEISIPPFGWYIDNITFKLVDMNSSTDYNSVEIHVKYDDNGGGHFNIISFKNDKNENIDLEVDSKDMIQISKLMDDFAKIMDKSFDKAYEETKPTKREE